MNYIEVYSVGIVRGLLYFFALIILILAFAILVAFFASCIYLKPYFNLVMGDYKIVEGVVEKFIPQSFSGKKHPEQFEINGIIFDYSSASITGAYNIPLSDGGYMLEGRRLKLYYHDNEILKIFIVKE